MKHITYLIIIFFSLPAIAETVQINVSPYLTTCGLEECSTEGMAWKKVELTLKAQREGDLLAGKWEQNFRKGNAVFQTVVHITKLSDAEYSVMLFATSNVETPEKPPFYMTESNTVVHVKSLNELNLITFNDKLRFRGDASYGLGISVMSPNKTP